LDARWLDDSRPTVIAVADGYGAGWAEIGESAGGADLTLKLAENLPVNGRILDQNRRPVAGATVLVHTVFSDSEEGVTRYVEGRLDSWSPRSWRGPFPEQPPGATTDADGRFRLTGLGRDRVVHLALEGPAVQHVVLAAVTRPPEAIPKDRRVNGATFDYVASPGRSIRGVVRDKTTGRPVAGVRVCSLPSTPLAFTDEDGRFEIPGFPRMPQGYPVMAQPQAGQPYFAASTSVPDKPGFDPLTVDVELGSGIPLTGRVTDQATGKPPRAAVVEYYPLFPNTHISRLTHCPATAASSALLQPDGSYRLVVLPGPGVVFVAASPRNSYAVALVDDGEWADFFRDGVNRGGGRHLNTAVGGDRSGILGVNKYNALSPINPDEKAESVALDLTLQPARTLPGTVVGPDGKPLTGVEVFGLTALPDEETLESASFTVTGLNPRGTRELCFHHREIGLGKVLAVRGDESGPLTVRLEPCGSVLGRLVDKSGNPVPGVTVWLRGGNGPGVLAKTDREGRFRGALPPGTKCSLRLYNSRRSLRAAPEVEVESGRDKDLGDLALGD
jgi:hypothetical protein